jgi:hypothetical protein
VEEHKEKRDWVRFDFRFEIFDGEVLLTSSLLWLCYFFSLLFLLAVRELQCCFGSNSILLYIQVVLEDPRYIAPSTSTPSSTSGDTT